MSDAAAVSLADETETILGPLGRFFMGIVSMGDDDSSNPLLPSYVAITWLLAFFLVTLLCIDAKCKCSFDCAGTSALESVYLPVYALAISADWLQGPYVYALYSALGFGRTEINVLFVMGFGTSMLLGPFIGQIADQFGRKQMILVMYCGGYALACVTKHFQLYWMLTIGRFLGGAATSVLFSCFESWLVAEHRRLSLSPEVLKKVLTRQYFINGLAGCSMGVLAQFAVDSMPIQLLAESLRAGLPIYVGGETLPFDMSAACLIIAAVLVCFMWSENIWYDRDDPSAKRGAGSAGATPISIRDALKRTASDWRLLIIMTVAGCTESAMYAFVIEWTPALTVGDVRPPHGLVFSCFMIAYMSGSTIFGILSACFEASTLLIGFSALSFASVATTWALLFGGYAVSPAGIFTVFLMLTCFELGLGGYMAAIAVLKAMWVPDDMRATVYNIFRVPLNLIVVVINVVSLSSEFTFLACTALMGLALMGALSTRAFGTPRPAAQEMW